MLISNFQIELLIVSNHHKKLITRIFIENPLKLKKNSIRIYFTNYYFSEIMNLCFIVISQYLSIPVIFLTVIRELFLELNLSFYMTMAVKIGFNLMKVFKVFKVFKLFKLFKVVKVFKVLTYC